LAQLVNFAIVAAILYFGVWKLMVRVLEARRERIARGLEDAQAAEQKLANAERDAQKLIDQRRGEANKLVEEARGRGEEQARVVLDEARREAESIRAKAVQEAENIKANALADVRPQIAQIAVAAAERVINQSLDENRARQIIDNFFTNLPEGATNIGGNIEVVSALRLSDEEQAYVRSRTGANNAEFRVDPSILGGLVIRSGDKVVDGSVRAGLSNLAARMN
jgi:F-type H+-transporting ATPase subunit b